MNTQGQDALPVTVYESDYLHKRGARAWFDMLGELYAFRGLVWRLILRDISARYKQSVLGVLWAFLAPLALTLVFVFVKGKGVLPIGETRMPYAAFVFFGQMVWFLFSHGVATATNALVDAGDMLTKINFPREVLVFSSLGQAVFDFLLRVPLLLLVFWWAGFVPDGAVILVPLVLLPLLALILGAGLLLSLVNAVVRDVGSMLGIVLTLGMFATPVIYPLSESSSLAFWLVYANPVTAFVVAARDLCTVGYLTDPAGYSYATLLAVLLFGGGWRLFHLVEPKIAERI